MDLGKLYLKYASRLWTAVPDLFYDRVFDDPSLSHFFKGASKNYMKDHLESLLHHFVGGPKLYQGRNLREAHANLNIDAGDFSRLIEHMRTSFADAGIEPADTDLVIARIEQEKCNIIKA